MRALILFCLLVVGYGGAQAKTSQNSQCYMLADGGPEKVHGDRVRDLFELASVSKVITSYWATQVLGPHFRFKTRIFTTPVGPQLYDVHIQGGQDPFWGRQLTHFLFSELNRLGIRQVRTLSFDENLNYRWKVLTDYLDSAPPSAQDIINSFIRHLGALPSEYTQTKKEADAAGVPMLKSVELQVRRVRFLSKNQFQPSAGSSAYLLGSAQLYRYLKEMNAVSNNHVADGVFEFLGGSGAFKNFILQDLNLDHRDLVLLNGSGNSIVGPQGKKYNLGTCQATLLVLRAMQGLLESKYGLGLKDVMAVSGADVGTLSPRFDSIPKSLIAKTGTVDPSVTLAGILATGEGSLFFGVFMNTEGPADWSLARNKVREKVMELLDQFGGRKVFDYTPRRFLTFDSTSALTLEAKH